MSQVSPTLNTHPSLPLHTVTKVANCLQKVQVQPRGSEVHVISNWNGTVELPAYDFGDEVLQEGSFGEALAVLSGNLEQACNTVCQTHVDYLHTHCSGSIMRMLAPPAHGMQTAFSKRCYQCGVATVCSGHALGCMVF